MHASGRDTSQPAAFLPVPSSLSVARFLVVREVTRCPATQQRKQASHNQRMRCDVKRREKCDLIDTIVLTWGFATARTASRRRYLPALSRWMWKKGDPGAGQLPGHQPDDLRGAPGSGQGPDPDDLGPALEHAAHLAQAAPRGTSCGEPIKACCRARATCRCCSYSRVSSCLALVLGYVACDRAGAADRPTVSRTGQSRMLTSSSVPPFSRSRRPPGELHPRRYRLPSRMGRVLVVKRLELR
jgi:hypothetical protein